MPSPLSTLLSHAFVAFTIELDNELEHRMPHWTTNHGRPAARPRDRPWLTSFVMWENCLRFVGEQGVTVGELTRLARTPTNLHGMERWGYITVAPKPPRISSLIRLTTAGQRAQAAWRPLPAMIEARWCERFGSQAIDRLQGSLVAIVSRFDLALPDCLPILSYGLTTTYRTTDREARDCSQLSISALLSKLLLSFALEFDRESHVSLAISANVLRLLDDAGVRARDLPARSGVSKEAIAVALNFLAKRDYATVEARVITLTASGRKARDEYIPRLHAIEARWEARFGQSAMLALRDSLETLTGHLSEGLVPYPDGWRAQVPKPGTLPHYPLVLHRGGYPDGS